MDLDRPPASPPATRSPAGSAPRSASAATAGSGGPKVEVRRSRKRVRTVSAYRDGDRTVVLLPARFTAAQEAEWVATMVRRLEAKERRRRPADDDLMVRARDLSRRYFEGRARPSSVAWVTNQNHRWGSCTPSEATIRLSSRLQGLPPWVVDYVLVHELAHLLESGHGQRFWQLVAAYPRAERARGYLEGFATGARLPIGEDGADGPDCAAADPAQGPDEPLGEPSSVLFD